MKHKFSKVFFVVAILLVVCLFAVACDDGQGNDNDPVKYAVSYVGGEGVTGTAPNGGEYEQGAKFTLPDAGTLSKADNNFGGWSYGGQTYAAGTEFTMPASAVEFTAVWTPVPEAETYAVTYNANGANGTVPTESEKAAGAKFTLATADGLSKADHVFGGWSYGGQTYAAGAEFTMPAEAVEFTAVWYTQFIQYDIDSLATLILNIDSNTGSIEIYDDIDESLSTVNFTYTLDGSVIVIVLENEGGSFNGTFENDVITINISYNDNTYVFKAEEEIIPPVVSFDANDGTGNAPQVTVETTATGYKFTIPQNTYTAPENKQFKAWEISVNDRSFGNYNPGKSFTANAGETITLKAIWEDIPVEEEPDEVNGVTFTGSYTYSNGIFGNFTFVQFTIDFDTNDITYVLEDGTQNTFKADAPEQPGYMPGDLGSDALFFDELEFEGKPFALLVSADRKKLLICSTSPTVLSEEFTAQN